MKKTHFAALFLFVSLFLVSTTSQAADHHVTIFDFYFEPAVLTVQEGDTVTWTSEGSFPHTTTSGTSGIPDGIWDSGFLFSGDSFTVVFGEAGDFPYYCIPHYSFGMDGTIIVEPVGPAEFTLELATSYDVGFLSLDFTVGTSASATWANFLVLTSPAVQVIPLWSVPLPVLAPPIVIPVSFPLPDLGLIGIFSALIAGDGVQASELAFVETGM